MPFLRGVLVGQGIPLLDDHTGLDVDEEGDDERQSALDAIVVVTLSHAVLVLRVDIAREDEA